MDNLQRVKKVIKAQLGTQVPSMLPPLAKRWEWPSGPITFKKMEIPSNLFVESQEQPSTTLLFNDAKKSLDPLAKRWTWPSEQNASNKKSAGMNQEEESDKKTWKNKDRSEQWYSNVTSGIQGGFNLLGSINTPDVVSENTNTFHNVTDGLTSVANNFGPLGQALGTAIQGVKFGYDVINNTFAQDTDKFSADRDVLAKAGASYNGAANSMLEAEQYAGKSHGFFDYKTFDEHQENINKAKQRLKTLRNITGKAENQRLAVASMGEQAGLAYDLLTNGGYDQKYTYAAKQGGVLEQPILEWEPEINQNIEEFKEGGLLEWEPEFFKQFKNGGVVTDSLEKEVSTQKNVIPEGALHKNRHHMEHAEGLTKKGIPVVDNEGNQQAEIENSEIIFNLKVTKQLEEYYKVFYSEESSNKEKEQAAIDAGKLLVYEILENTDDRMGLIESCKQGGVLSNTPTQEKSSTDEDIKQTVKGVLLELINK